MVKIDYNSLIGKKFNLLTILCEAPKRPGNNNRRISALCDCGNAGTFIASEVIHGKTKSCGCLNNQSKNISHGHVIRKKMSPEYYSWAAMKSRCLNKNATFYYQYGGRGIKICERWMKFANFLEDMGIRPKGTSLDRIDSNGDYELKNCKWSTRTEQSNNRRSNTYYEYNNQQVTIAQLAEISKIAYNTLHARLVRFKWPIEKAISKIPRKSRYSIEIIHHEQ